jgi:hypothetical protein
MAKTSMATKKEIIGSHGAKYRKSSKKAKGTILSAVCLATGLSRDRAARLLSGTTKRVKGQGKRGRKPRYVGSVKLALERVWAYMDFASGRRLVAGMNDMLTALTRFGEINLSDEVLALLRNMSPATADRLLKRSRERMILKGRSTTKPGTLLKKAIPVRLGTEWNDAVPGYVEIDLVAHCGDTAAGDYLSTLDLTDICTGWTETHAAFNKAQVHVFGALRRIEERLPFPVRGIDSDNGSEFINNHLYRYCREKNICFTRSRSYQKNDNCHVEQKNWHVVRRNIGYDRYEGKMALAVMNEYYSLLRLYTNFFLPQTKLIAKHRDGARVYKRYEIPETPYRRVLRSDSIPEETKVILNQTFVSLNPAKLKRDMMLLLDKLSKWRV